MKELILRSIRKLIEHKTIMLHFVSGQALSQLFSFIASFFLLRWLSIEEQAKFSFIFSIQNSLIQVSDLGITASIMALVSTRYQDKEIVGKYISAAFYLRLMLLIAAAMFLILVAPFIVYRQHWSKVEFVFLFLLILVSVIALGRASVLQSTLLMHKRIKTQYAIQNISSVIRLIGILIAKALVAMNAFSIIAVNTLSYVYQSARVNKFSSAYYSKIVRDKEAVREIIRYITPVFPSAIFFAFQSQIMLFIVSFFGDNKNIAEVGALSRLGQIFVFLSSFNNILLLPYIARSSEFDLKRKYLQVIIISVIAYCVIVGFVLIFPSVFMFYLGDNYSNLRSELILSIVTTCLINFEALIWGMNMARKWQRKWYPYFHIGGTIVMQIIGVLVLPVNTTAGILWMAFFTSVYIFILQILVGFLGFSKTNVLNIS